MSYLMMPFRFNIITQKVVLNLLHPWSSVSAPQATMGYLVRRVLLVFIGLNQVLMEVTVFRADATIMPTNAT